MSNFDIMCKEAVKRFIRTVAVIDDEATYDMNLSSLEAKDKTKTANPPVAGLMTENLDAGPSVINENQTTGKFRDEKDENTQLDAKVVINAFADMHIACCIQRPKHEELPCDRAVKLATSTDVLVLDWVLDKRNIRLPRDIIRRIMEEDKSKGGRMRLIIVYTSYNYVDQMLKDLKEDVDKTSDDDMDMDRKHLLIKGKRLRIVILNKEATKEPLREAQIVPFDKLPEHIISEYVELVKGVIPCATLHSIAAIREKTHQLLSILNSNLDGAYCLHRALLPESSDSVDFAMGLITREIETIVQTDIKARQFVDRNGLKAWFDNYAGKKKMLPYRDSSLSGSTVWKCIDEGQLSNNIRKNTLDKEFSYNLVQAKTSKRQVIKLVDGKQITFSDAKKLIEDDKWDQIRGCQPPKETHFAEVLYDPSNKAIIGCNELSRLQCTTRDMTDRSHFDISQNPTLQLGTILKVPKKGANEWILCLTPLCDCVRLEEETNLLFLQLYYPGKKDQADIIIKMQDGTFKPLVVKVKNKKLKMVTIPFRPTSNSDRIHAKRWHGEWRIKSSNGTSYQWMAELRYTKALAIVHRVAANTSRVGIDEFEWLRRQATLIN